MHSLLDQNLACVLQDLKTVNADLQAYVQAKERELAQAHQQLILKVKACNSVQEYLFHALCQM